MDLWSLLTGKKKDLVSLAIDEALGLMAEGEYDEAIRVLTDKALRREPEHRRALLHKGIAYMLNGKPDMAEPILRPLTEMKGMDSEKAMAQIALEKMAKERDGE